MSRSIRIHPRLYTGPWPRGKLWSSTVFFSGLLFQQSSTTSTPSPFTSFCIFHYQLHFSRLWGKSCTLSPASFSPICGWTVHIFAEQKGPGHLSYWHHPNSIPAKFYYNFPDISLSTPLSRLWGMSCTSSPTLLSPICSWNAHFSFAGLMCLYSFPKRHYSLSWQLKLEGAAKRRAGRPRSLLRVTHLLLWHSAPKWETITNPAVRHGAWLLFSGFLLWFANFSFFFGGLVPPSQFHRAPCARCKLAAFTGAHAVPVSMPLALTNLMYSIFSNSILTPIHVHHSQVSDQDSASNLLCFILHCSGAPSCCRSAPRYTESRTLRPIL